MATNQNRLDKSLVRTRIRGSHIQQLQPIRIQHLRETDGKIHRIMGIMQKNMAKHERVRMHSRRRPHKERTTSTNYASVRLIESTNIKASKFRSVHNTRIASTTRMYAMPQSFEMDKRTQSRRTSRLDMLQ